MKKIDKNGKRRKLNIKYVYKTENNSLTLYEILKEGYLCYVRNLKQ